MSQLVVPIVPLAELGKACTHFLGGDGPRCSTTLLAHITTCFSEDTVMDVYGEGGAVAELETEVAHVLGKPRALFTPTGVMAQQAVLRVLTDRQKDKRVAMHPMCHLRTHEENAFALLHGLLEVVIKTSGPMGPVTLAGLDAIQQPIGVLVLELPQRDIGGHLPTWEELCSLVGWARTRGAGVHLDGARLWEAAPYYAATAGKSMADICALFDTAYVSFYKGLGAIAGACLVGPADIVAEASLWRTRHGGRAYMLWPYAASCLNALRTRPRDMHAYYRRAVALAEALRDIPGIEILPTSGVRSPLMHLRFSATLAEMEGRVRAIAVERGVMTLPRVFSSDGLVLQRYEYQVGRASLQFSLPETVALFSLLAGHPAPAPVPQPEH